MAKRKLTKQQQVRISANQNFNPDTDDASAENSNQSMLGLVISHFGQQLEIEPLDQNWSDGTVRCFQRTNLPPLVTGDRVRFQLDGANTGVILAAEKRRNQFARPGFKGQIKPVAANIDAVLVVFAVLPEPFMNLTDRYLVAIESLGLDAIVVLNKSDLVDDANRGHIDNIMSIYTDIGYPTYRVSVITGQGIPELESALTGKTTVFVGQSGVGKSSLINRLSDNESALVGRLSVGKEKGTHTTTTAKLFHLGNCDLVDSPGIREFNLGHIDPEKLIAGFRELNAFRGQCKFRDCSHQQEPDCAIQEAVANGAVSKERLANYFQILQSNAN